MPRVRKPRTKKTETTTQSNVVNLETVKETRKRSSSSTSTDKLDAFYAKYSWVKPGSVREVEKGTEVDGVVSKGKMCTVLCTDCNVERTVNTQDAFQVKRCSECKKKALVARRQERRARVKAS